MTQPATLEHGTRVRATETLREVHTGDTGTVCAAWTRARVGVRWDKDGRARLFHRKRLEVVAPPEIPDSPGAR